MSSLDFDHIIIGAGTAGCLLANRLSADPRRRVLLIEAGRKDDYHWVHIPVGYLYCIGNPRTDWMYQTEPTAGLNGRSLRYPRGKVLGGCSSINGMIYMRGQARDYDHWAQVTGDDGSAVRWGAEMVETPGILKKRNKVWSKDSIKPGDQIEIVCKAPRDPAAKMCRAQQFTVNGKRLY